MDLAYLIDTYYESAVKNDPDVIQLEDNWLFDDDRD
jgi:hypothetical protein